MTCLVAAVALYNDFLENECTRSRISETKMTTTTTKTIKIIFTITSYVSGGKHQKYNSIFDIISIYERNNTLTHIHRQRERQRG